MISKITGGETNHLFKALVLQKFEVDFYQCIDTGFIQTQEPYWLDEAYSSAITSLDIGLVKRNIALADITEKIIGENLNPTKQFVDFAGGYGLFTRMMRDKGYAFYHTDKFCDNLFAKYFDINDIKKYADYEILTAFELFEHLPHPITAIKEMFLFSDTILFSTELVPKHKMNSASDWWYFSPETGQHVSFYTLEALQNIAKQLNAKLFTNNSSLHLFTRKEGFSGNIFAEVKHIFSGTKVRRWDTSKRSPLQKMKKFCKETLSGKYIDQQQSLLQKDYEFVKSIITTKSTS